MGSAQAVRRVVVILGHPRGAASLSGALAEAYANGARAAGWHVDFFDLSTQRFDVNLVHTSPRQQALEQDLERIREAIDRADHLAFVYPTWWGTMPALMKGFLDRILLPGWAFAVTTGGSGYEGLLRGKTAQILTTMDTPDFVYRWIYGAPGHRAMARATLSFCGVDVTRISPFGIAKDAPAGARARWIGQARGLGRRLEFGSRGPVQRACHRARPWLRALRLQFYPMTFIAYWVGALAALGFEASLKLPAFWLGYAVLFLLEVATVFTNDVHDFESDQRNAHWGPFTGGSRVLVAGELSPEALMRAAVVALAAALAVAGLLVLATPAPVSAALVLAVLAVLALGYTMPPLKLCHRALGEIDVALTHSLGVLLLGYVAQGGAVSNTQPYLLSLPLFLAVLPAITLSGVPDSEADGATGKNTLVVKAGISGGFAFAGASAFAAAGAAIWMRHAAGIEAFAGLEVIAPVHAALLLILIAAEARRGCAARRIDRLMVAALTFILWFGLIPLINLLA